MMLKTKGLAVATGSVAIVALAGLIWQVARGPGEEGGAAAPAGSASGVVTRSAPPPVPAPAPAPAPIAVPVPEPEVAATTASQAPAPATAAPPAPSPATPRTASPAPTAPRAAAPAPATGGVKHRVEPRAALPPIVPTDVGTVIDRALDHKTLARFIYLEPLARRFVATVDGLGQQRAPTRLWLLRPAPGEFQLAKNRTAEDTSQVAATNSRRYQAFVRWIDDTDTAQLVALYARMYPLLQQTYVELGHPGGYFNDRLIEVIDQMLATPTVRPPLRVLPASADMPASPLSATTPPPPRFEMAEPALEALTTGQKTMLRVGPEHAAKLKAKLRALRAGIVQLGRPG